MSKELLIVFVYDCERCKKEEDDPQDAVVFFYPSWVSEQQRLALCGQLMGVSQFLSTVFSPPKILALQTGKFAVKALGRYVLCVGTDRNIPDLVLNTRMDSLYHLLRFYHLDFETIAASVQENDFSEKLNKIFEVYLPILQYAGNIFGSIATINLPKSASSVFLEAIQTLQCFQNTAGVLGGALLHQNKVVATQLSAKLTKLLVITDPYRIKLPCEPLSSVQFRLPVGVQLVTVYVPEAEVRALAEEGSLVDAALKATRQRIGDKEAACTKPPAVVKEGLKRDVSCMFTTVLEEGEGEGEEVPDVVRDAVRARHAARLLGISPAGFVLPDPTCNKRAQTTDDIPDSTIKTTIRYQSLGLADGGGQEREGEGCGGGEGQQLRPYYNTLADPSTPLFRRSGLPASRALYDSRVTRHYNQLTTEKNEKKPRPRSFVTSLLDGSPREGKRERAKRALKLPLNNVSLDTNDMVPLVELGPRKPNLSIPLTPLMAKLSLLAMEQGGGGGGPPPTTPRLPAPAFATERRPPKRPVQGEEGKLSRHSLYVCGYQDMTLLLLLEEESSRDPERIHSLWERSVRSLGELECQLTHCLEHWPGSGSGAGAGHCESYSYACVAPEWGTVQRGGAWPGARLELLTQVHQQFNTTPNLVETIVRTSDSIVYGWQSGGGEGASQVFYQQPCPEGGVSGLPAPSDLMGFVSLKAKRRLERDHGIVLL